jgi:hypothetical protein
LNNLSNRFKRTILEAVESNFGQDAMDQGIVIDQATDFSQIDADISLSFYRFLFASFLSPRLLDGPTCAGA